MPPKALGSGAGVGVGAALGVELPVRGLPDGAGKADGAADAAGTADEAADDDSAGTADAAGEIGEADGTAVAADATGEAADDDAVAESDGAGAADGSALAVGGPEVETAVGDAGAAAPVTTKVKTAIRIPARRARTREMSLPMAEQRSLPTHYTGLTVSPVGPALRPVVCRR